MDKAGIPYGMTLPAAGIVCFVFGFLFGLPALRLEGVYLALATFALAVATPQILKLSPLEYWTGGVQGIVINKPDAPFGLPLNPDQWLYYFTLSVAVVMTVLAHNLIASRTGRAMMAIRDNPTAARSMGINTALYKSLTFGVSALYTGVAGALGAIVVQFVAPDSFTFFLSITLLVGLVVGGVGWIPGAFFGGAFVLFVPNFAESLSKGLSGAVYGVMIILLIYVLPTGAAGLVRAVSNWLRDRGGPSSGQVPNQQVPSQQVPSQQLRQNKGGNRCEFRRVDCIWPHGRALRASQSGSPRPPAPRRNTTRARPTPKSRSATSCPIADPPRPTG